MIILGLKSEENQRLSHITYSCTRKIKTAKMGKIFVLFHSFGDHFGKNFRKIEVMKLRDTKRFNDVVIKGVKIASTNEFVQMDNVDGLESMFFNDYRQIKFELGGTGLYFNLNNPVDEIINDDEMMGVFFRVARHIKPCTTTVCVKNKDNKYTIATEEDLRNIVGLSDKKYRKFMKITEEAGLIKKQRFIHGNFYHYEFMVNPVYANLLLGKIFYSDFLVWESDVRPLYNTDYLVYWMKKIPYEFADECEKALVSGTNVISNKKLLRDFNGFTKYEWKGLKTPRGKLK